MIKDLEFQKIALDMPESIRIAIVKSTYHAELNNNMAEYCKEVLVMNGLLPENIDVYEAPGTWEVPLIVQKLANTQRYEAIVAFAIILKGDTYHFDMIANEAARALMQTMVSSEIPVGFEILAVENIGQAIERASKDKFNKGIEAGNAVLAAINTLRKIA